MLDSRFFKRIATRTHDAIMYEAYEAVYAQSTMVLFSRKTKTPLAALTLKAEDVGCLSMLTGRPSPQGATEPYFQGMLNMSGQVFDFTISNLSDKGMVNFNVLHTPHRVSSVDPGPVYGVNQVNELHKNQSYTIEADQRNNRKMILKGKTQRVTNFWTGQAMEVSVTVKDSETKEEKPTGLYFYLSVVPDRICHELVEKFAEGTIWKVVPGFVRRVNVPPISSPSHNPPDHMHRHFILDGSIDFGPPVTLEELEVQRAAMMSMEVGSASYTPPRSRSLAGSKMLKMCKCVAQSMTCLSRPDFKKARKPKRLQQEASRDRVEGNSNNNHNSNNNNNNHNQEQELGSVEPVEVGSTQAAELKYGSRVNLLIGHTENDYAYDLCSEPTVLCMSIWKDMKFLALLPKNDIEMELNQEIDEWIQNKKKELVESLNAIYKSETCVLDLESEADTIIITCGHQCVNHANIGKSNNNDHLRHCPLCRSPITAFVQADGIMVVE